MDSGSTGFVTLTVQIYDGKRSIELFCVHQFPIPWQAVVHCAIRGKVIICKVWRTSVKVP